MTRAHESCTQTSNCFSGTLCACAMCELVFFVGFLHFGHLFLFAQYFPHTASHTHMHQGVTHFFL